MTKLYKLASEQVSGQYWTFVRVHHSTETASQYRNCVPAYCLTVPHSLASEPVSGQVAQYRISVLAYCIPVPYSTVPHPCTIAVRTIRYQNQHIAYAEARVSATTKRAYVLGHSAAHARPTARIAYD
eukprot:1475915-Rhodomonas_salina.1